MNTGIGQITPLSVVAALALAALVAGCASRPQRVPVTVQEIVQMSHEGLPSSDIIGRLEASDTVYRLSGSELADLKARGVPDEVLDYMQETYIEYERSRVFRRYDPWWGSSYYPYPYPYPYPYAYPYAYPYGGYFGYYYPYRPYHRHRPPSKRPPKSSPPASVQPDTVTPFWGGGNPTRGGRQQVR